MLAKERVVACTRPHGCDGPACDWCSHCLISRAAGRVAEHNNAALERMGQDSARLKQAKQDTERLEFVFSCLNEMELLARFVDMWCDTMSTSQRRAESATWRKVVDLARGSDAARAQEKESTDAAE